MRRLWAAFAFLSAATLAVPAAADTRTIYATQSGLPAYDSDPFGGNPFASALIAALRDEAGDPSEKLVADTITNSGGMQFPDLSRAGEGMSLAPADGETAMALVIVFADYSDEDGLVSLPGAAFDAIRVGRALADAGYEVRTVVAVDAAGYREEVSAFARETDAADRALLYTTGHGVEVAGTIWLVPPEAESAENMLTASIPMTEIEARFDGPGKRLLLYAGCRDNPGGLTIPAPERPSRAP